MKEQIKKWSVGILTVLLALLLAAGVLAGSAVGANALRESTLVTQSQVLRAVLSEQSVGVVSFLQDGRRMDMLRSFIRAVTEAYVNFELIPVNEGKTFAAIFTSLPEGVTVEQFVYHRRDLEIIGWATPEGYESFVSNLEDTRYFYQITTVETEQQEDGSLAFILLCEASPVNNGFFGEP